MDDDFSLFGNYIEQGGASDDLVNARRSMVNNLVDSNIARREQQSEFDKLNASFGNDPKPPPPSKYACPICHKTCRNAGALRNHTNTHGSNVRSKSGETIEAMFARKQPKKARCAEDEMPALVTPPDSDDESRPISSHDLLVASYLASDDDTDEPAAAASPKPKQRRHSYSIELKREVLQELDTLCEQTSVDEAIESVAVSRDIPLHTVRHWREKSGRKSISSKRVPADRKRMRALSVKLGRPVKLGRDKEADLVDWIEDQRNNRKHVDAKRVLKKAKEMGLATTFGAQWVRRFMKRHRLSYQSPSNIKTLSSAERQLRMEAFIVGLRERKTGPPLEGTPCPVCPDLQYLFGIDLVEGYPQVHLTDHEPSPGLQHFVRHENLFSDDNLVNMDQSPLAPKASTTSKTIGFIGRPQGVSEPPGVDNKRIATLVVATSPPNNIEFGVIFKGVKKPKKAESKLYPKEITVWRNPKGWYNKDSHGPYLRRMFAAVHPADAESLSLLDNYKVHRDPDFKRDLLERHKSHVHFGPAKTTEHWQPNDGGIIALAKHYVEEGRRRDKDSDIDVSTLSARRVQLLRNLKEAREKLRVLRCKADPSMFFIERVYQKTGCSVKPDGDLDHRITPQGLPPLFFWNIAVYPVRELLMHYFGAYTSIWAVVAQYAPVELHFTRSSEGGEAPAGSGEEESDNGVSSDSQADPEPDSDADSVAPAAKPAAKRAKPASSKPVLMDDDANDSDAVQSFDSEDLPPKAVDPIDHDSDVEFAKAGVNLYEQLGIVIDPAPPVDLDVHPSGRPRRHGVQAPEHIRENFL